MVRFITVFVVVVVVAALVSSAYARPHQKNSSLNERQLFRGFNDTIYPGQATYYDRELEA
jgi:hypothetical protein